MSTVPKYDNWHVFKCLFVTVMYDLHNTVTV